MRERLDKVDPRLLREAFTQIFSLAQRGKVLEDFKFLDDCVLVACDGTGIFSSEKIHCENCCERHHQNGTVTYYHQMLAGAVIHPDHREVLLLFGLLMFLAFFIDQMQQHCCGLFQAAVKKAGSRARFWRRQQSIFTELYIVSWEDLFLWMVTESTEV